MTEQRLFLCTCRDVRLPSAGFFHARPDDFRERILGPDPVNIAHLRSIAVIPDFIYLPLAITAALIAGVLSLLVSWTEEKKEKEAKQKKNNLFIMHIYMFPRNMRSAV